MNMQKMTVKRLLKYGIVLNSMVVLTGLAQAEVQPNKSVNAVTAAAETKKTTDKKNVSLTPATPATPTAPATSATPATPAVPATSAIPVTPAVPATPAAPESPVLSVAAGDWNGDRKSDAALLFRAGDQADLYLYLNNGQGGLELKLVKKALVWTGSLAGMFPKLTTGKRGVLYVDSQNEAIGRNRWSQRLTIDYRKNDFLVIGYDYTERDTLNPSYSLDCDFNFLTGKGTKNKQSVKLTKQVFKLSEWKEENAANQCRNSN